jgi:hypothetical protein
MGCSAHRLLLLMFLFLSNEALCHSGIPGSYVQIQVSLTSVLDGGDYMGILYKISVISFKPRGLSLYLPFFSKEKPFRATRCKYRRLDM